MDPSGFDRANSESPFLAFVAAEFERRGTSRRKELAQKIISHPFVEDLGMRVPKRIAILDSLDRLHGESLPDMFVLKLANGWSSRGVMILERTGPDEYFDHMNLQTLDVASIVRIQLEKAASFSQKEARWIVEELVVHTLGVGAIPFDYKFYCFQGEVGLVVQIDRNSGPVRIVLFDGDFRPLKLGTDYLLSDSAKPGVPVVPLNAPEMLWWAQRLSLEADSPFVSIDMFDSPTGPVFGEFTYSPGGTHRRMFVFSHGLLDRLDELITQPGRSVDSLAGTSLELRKSLAHPGALAYRAWAGYAYGGGPRGAERLHVHYRQLAANYGPGDPLHDWYRRLSAVWAAIRDRLRVANRKRLLPASRTVA
ncbi:ATP-grasp fold amidoligase family protein [uncultured Arthrobacter sp.]|uniref:ATP-grasp fold amidoligase family protein n=1 Tax=uncultured Arthrobacter sp. TaxID=114050 RepID=UPI0032179B1B